MHFESSVAMAKRGRGSTSYRELGDEEGWSEAQLKAAVTPAAKAEPYFLDPI